MSFPRSMTVEMSEGPGIVRGKKRMCRSRSSCSNDAAESHTTSYDDTVRDVARHADASKCHKREDAWYAARWGPGAGATERWSL